MTPIETMRGISHKPPGVWQLRKLFAQQKQTDDGKRNPKDSLP